MYTYRTYRYTWTYEDTNTKSKQKHTITKTKHKTNNDITKLIHILLTNKLTGAYTKHRKHNENIKNNDKQQ